MKQELLDQLAKLDTELAKVRPVIDLSAWQQHSAGIRSRLADPVVWTDRELFTTLNRELVKTEKEYETWSRIFSDYQALQELSGLMHDGDADWGDWQQSVHDLEQRFATASVLLYLHGPYDAHHAFFEIHAGMGGEDAEDFVAMLLRMYLRYFESKDFTVTMLEENQSEAGYKRVVLEVKGDYAYGYLKSEKGVHRLIRLSPFKSSDSRQTSFALVNVLPMVQHETVGKINESDLKIDTFRSSGAGGQKVNKTSSAVRLTHLPTGVVVTCQSERSQAQNKERALAILYAKLHEKNEQEKARLEKDLRGDFVSAELGNQIRSYTIHPYKLVKDHRTNIESTQVEKVFDGELDLFVQGYLLSHKAA